MAEAETPPEMVAARARWGHVSTNGARCCMLTTEHDRGEFIGAYFIQFCLATDLIFYAPSGKEMSVNVYR